MRILSRDIRPAVVADAEKIANVYWTSWQHVYAGVIPPRALQDMLTRRNVRWWKNAIQDETTVLVLEVRGNVVGYATAGLSRARALPQEGEIFEIYLLPEYQGLGFGRELFCAAKKLLASLGCNGTICWSVDVLDQAALFFTALGGQTMAFAEESFGGTLIGKISFVWD